ncbi:hypothetical protein D3C78_1217860 [compost metagenome]
MADPALQVGAPAAQAAPDGRQRSRQAGKSAEYAAAGADHAVGQLATPGADHRQLAQAEHQAGIADQKDAEQPLERLRIHQAQRHHAQRHAGHAADEKGPDACPGDRAAHRAQ